MIDDAVAEGAKLRTVADEGGRFVAATLVHTKNGLVSIEQVRVGDWVLSQPEGRGERSYKRVANTFRSDEQQVSSVFILDLHDLGHPIGLLATGVHPFWVKGKGWTPCDQLTGADTVELADGAEGAVISVRPVFRTGDPGRGWVPAPVAGSGREYWELGGLTIDFDKGETQPKDYLAGLVPFPGDFLALHEERCQLRVPVYNIEVEDHHTYYVGAKGVWVHNVDCG
jgi:hypothetical protein